MSFLDQVKNKYPELETIFEIGAHRGYDIIEILKKWPNAEIYAFEADPCNYKICHDKFKDIPNVHVYNLAVTNVTGPVIFNRFFDVESISDAQTYVGQNMQNTGCGSILKSGKGLTEIYKISQVKEEIKVDGISLYDFCSTNNISKIDAIFMDVQGAEMMVFEGCKDLINTLKATVFEWSTNYILYDGETDFNFIKPFLESKGINEVSREYQLMEICGDSLFMKQDV